MGGRLAPEWVAGINRNGWPASSGITGRNRAEYAAKGRDVIQSGEGYQLRESPAPYEVLFEAENEDIDHENTVFWRVKEE